MIRKQVDQTKSRFLGMNIIIAVIFCLIAYKLIVIQGFQSAAFRQEAESKSTKDITRSAPRGNILTSDKVLLATSQQSYSLTFDETDESKRDFVTTLEKINKLLLDNGESLTDDFSLRIAEDGSYYFDFNSQNADTIKVRQLLFLKDRSLDSWIMSQDENLKNKKKEELTDEEKALIDNRLLKLTPKQVFDKLWNTYSQYYTVSTKKNTVDQVVVKKLKNYTPKQKRDFILIKDALYIQSISGYKPITIASNIKKDSAIIFSQKLNELPGIDIALQPIRVYPNKTLAAHLLGYVSKIDPEQKVTAEKAGYDVSTDYVGKSGVEKAYENYLKGTKGEDIVQVNAQGRAVKEISSTEPSPGGNVYLTINAGVQEAAEASLAAVIKKLQDQPLHGDVNTKNATRGCAIAVDVSNGNILALANFPNYDPNTFSVPGQLTTELANRYFNVDLSTVGKEYIQSKNLLASNPGKTVDQIFNAMFPIDTSIKDNSTIRKDLYDVIPKPFYNYALMSLVPPGSTFKPITALAGLDTGKITTSFSIEDKGSFTGYDNRTVRFAAGSYGKVDLYTALEVSSNPFFMTVAHLLIDDFNKSSFKISTYDTLAKYAWKFGLGAKPGDKTTTGIEFPTEENFGQVYNVATATRINSDLYLLSVIDLLKNQKDANGNKDATVYPVIDISASETDSKEVTAIKTKIKSDIRNKIKTGDRNTTELAKLFTSLVNKDVTYQNTLFTSDNIKEICKVITEFSYYTGYKGLRTPFYVYNAAIGQGISQFTPLQLASYVSTLANGGTRYALHFVDKVTDSEGNVVSETKPEVLGTAGISKAYLDAVKEGMYLVDNGPRGTAKGAFAGFPIVTAGKTGSATFDANQTQRGRTSYALYIGFAPYDNPKIAVCVVVFDGGHGGLIAPVGRAMFEAYFKDELLSKYNYKVPDYSSVNIGTNKGD